MFSPEFTRDMSRLFEVRNDTVHCISINDVVYNPKMNIPLSTVFGFKKFSSDFQKACVEDKNKAIELNKILQPLHEAMFIESNPSPVKYAASLLNMCNAEVRLPLVEVTEASKNKISEALKVAKIL